MSSFGIPGVAFVGAMRRTPCFKLPARTAIVCSVRPVVTRCNSTLTGRKTCRHRDICFGLYSERVHRWATSDEKTHDRGIYPVFLRRTSLVHARSSKSLEVDWNVTSDFLQRISLCNTLSHSDNDHQPAGSARNFVRSPIGSLATVSRLPAFSASY